MLNNIFLFIAAVLVIFMQAGFALLEAGLTRAKNVSNIMMKNLMDFSIAAILFFFVGFAFAFGSDTGGLIGTDGFFLDAGAFDQSGLQVETQFIFQVAFAGAAATIASGAMAERTKFKSYVIFSAIMTAFIYPVVVHWFWGGGWIADLDIGGRTFGDFAGSTIVHSTGGWAALMGAILLGPRIGKYSPDGKPRAIPGHSIPFAILGVFILWIGWYGFNPGSELAADTAVVPIAVTTTLAAAAGALLATATIWIKSGKPDVAMAGNGVLAGLVGITAGCATMDNWGAIITGAIAGVIVVFAVLTLDRLKIDDPVGAVSVHAICGVWGTLAIGLFSTKADGFVADDDFGLFYGGGVQQLIVQLIGVVGVAVWTLVTTGIVFSVLKATIGLRVSEEEEMEGLDVLEHGAPGYSHDVVAGGVSGSTAATAPVA
ncbi:MAG: ammonium transporter [Actinomycetota bacterium]|nr:ammonium transporter [Actinomycetota bacterium]